MPVLFLWFSFQNPEQSADEEEEKDEIESGSFPLIQYLWTAIDWFVWNCVFKDFIWSGGSSAESDEDGDEGVTAKSFMKKKPQEEEKKAPEASKFLKGAAVSPILTI